MSTIALFDPPVTSTRKKGPSSLRSFKSKTSRSESKTSNSSKDSLFSDLLGIKARNTPAEITFLEDSPTLNFSSSVSIASGSTDSTASSSSTLSTASTATKASSISLVDHDLFGNKQRPTQEPQAQLIPNVVELGEQTYKINEPLPKQFYRDLTFMEDYELIQKYELVKVEFGGDGVEEEPEEEIQDDEGRMIAWLKHPTAPKISISKFV